MNESVCYCGTIGEITVDVVKTYPPILGDPCSHFEAVEARLLRAAVGTFLDLLNLATRTLETFGNQEATSQQGANVAV